MTTPPDDTTTDLHAVIAALRKERDALAETLARRNSEYGERIEQQAATIDVLRAMSSSPGDAKPVFNLMVERARAFCGADNATAAVLDGDMLRLMAQSGMNGEAGRIYAAQFPRPIGTDSLFGRSILKREAVQVPDVWADPNHYAHGGVLSESRAVISVPLLRGGTPIGAMTLGRRVPGKFSVIQVELLQTFAEQAVIATTSAETYRALQSRTADLQESLEYQAATSDVLKVISRSTFDLQPVLDTVVETAARLCDADMAVIARREGEFLRGHAYYGYPSEYRAWIESLGAYAIDGSTVGHRAAREGCVVHVHDVAADPDYPTEPIALGKQRTSLGVPLLREGETIGIIVLARQRVEPFTDRQIELVSTFADQAVIAIENTRLLTEQREALEQQTATAEVLQVINASPGNLAPVFEALLDRAMSLCQAKFGVLVLFEGERVRVSRGVPSAYSDFVKNNPVSDAPETNAGRIMRGAKIVHNPDLMAEAAYRDGNPDRRALVDLGGARTALAVALRKDDTPLGMIAVYRQEARPFGERQIALLNNFAAQAVIAIENARLLNEVRQRQEELRITFENMGDGVAMFDQTQRLVAWNGKFQEIFDIPGDLLHQHRTYEGYLRFLAARGDFGADVNTAEQIAELVATTGQPYGYERTRPDGRVIEIRRNPVPDGGFVLMFSDITERKRSEAEIRVARDAAEAAYRDLKAAQASLIQAEKMASLGQLTAGIAHEIKNPLNFVNNFASLSVDLLDELKQTVAPGLAALDEARRAEVDELASTLESNLGKINEHGRRANGIVQGMLEHSRGSSGERREVELNALVDEALNLAYHGARAQDQSFSVTLLREFDEGIAPITLAPQEVTRVLLNLFSNGFYAVRERQRTGSEPSFEPTLTVSTRGLDGAVEIRVHDNGIGIADDIKDKLFQPFFTTKPTGEGTGLGLSITYDIVTQQHGGVITVDSKVGDYSEFTVRLPRSLQVRSAHTNTVSGVAGSQSGGA